MRVAYLEGLFSTAILSSVMLRGSPCGNPCFDAPASVAVYEVQAPDGGLEVDAGFSPSPGVGTLAQCQRLCGDDPSRTYAPHVTGCNVVAKDAGGLEVVCDQSGYQSCSGGGRRTAGVTDGAFAGRTPIAKFFAYSAVLEASSVLSFRRLRAELHAHGAPRKLLHAMSRAARDESRHARSMASLARREGARVAPPHATPLRKRGLFDIALENAIEGCVVETYSALLARWQSQRATDPRVRSTMRRIAREETRHAALAWDLANWAEARLDKASRDEVHRARRKAFSALVPRVRANADPQLVEAGLAPSANEAEHLVQVLEAGLVTMRT